MHWIRLRIIVAVLHALELANGHVGVAVLKSLDRVICPDVNGLDVLFPVR